VVTHIGQFYGRSVLTARVDTIASRHLLRATRGRVEGTVASPQPFGDWLDHHLQPEPDVVDAIAPAAVARRAHLVHLRDAAVPGSRAAEHLPARRPDRHHRYRDVV
jgi:hypothetical protein